MMNGQRTSKPNIVMIMADQLSAGAIGGYGHPVVKTPHLDRLMQSSVSFANCYCNNPMCCPSRASMVTGKFPSRVGVYDNGSELAASAPTFMHHLRREGYRTLLSGKMHFIGPDQFHGFEERLTPDIYPASFQWTPDWERGAHLNPGSNVEPVHESGVCLHNLQLEYDEEVHYRALESLRRQALRQGKEQDAAPFFLCVSYTHPHDPFVTTPEWWELYRDADIPMPASPPQPLEEMHPYNQWIQIHHGADRYPLSEEHVRAARRAYYGMVSYFDDRVGQLLSELDRLLLSDNTIVIVTSDHGEMLGEHGMWFKRTFFDEASKVPLIVSIPGSEEQSGTMVDEVVSLVDLFPTLCELAGARLNDKQLQDLDGRSLTGLLAGEGADWMDEAILEYCGEGTIKPLRMLREGKYKYVLVDSAPPQLFDLENDPLEQHNVAGIAPYADTERRMKEKLLSGWDSDLVEERIKRSQRERKFINEAMAKGLGISWDIEPGGGFDKQRRYVRENSQAENESSRYPATGDSHNR